MTNKLILTAILATMMATGEAGWSAAMACTDWKAIAAFDATLASYDSAIATMHGSSSDIGAALAYHSSNTAKDREAALADKCQESAK